MGIITIVTMVTVVSTPGTLSSDSFIPGKIWSLCFLLSESSVDATRVCLREEKKFVPTVAMRIPVERQPCSFYLEHTKFINQPRAL